MTVELTADDANRWNTAVQQRVLIAGEYTSEKVYAAWELFCRDNRIPHIVLSESGDMTVSTLYMPMPPSMFMVQDLVCALEEIGTVQRLYEDVDTSPDNVEVLLGVEVDPETEPDRVAETLERVLDLLRQFKPVDEVA